MSFTEQIIDIIQSSIISIKIKVWDDACEEIISILLELDFKILIDNYQPCTNPLYISKQELSLLIKKSLFKLSTFFTKMNDETYIPNENISEEEIERLVETGVKILVKKQEGSFINISFSSCPNPETELREKDIKKVERLIQKEKFNYLNKKSVLARSITTLQAKRGLDIYREMLNAPIPSCDIFIYSSSFNVLYQTLYYLYKSINGKIYILHSLCGFITYYQLIEDESWFTNQI